MHDCPGPFATVDPKVAKKCPLIVAAGVFSAKAPTMDDLAALLGLFPVIDRFVTNETGLEGRYDAEVLFTPTFITGPNGSMVPSGADGNLFDALSEQLGLKLERRRAPGPVWVVDAVEPPSPN